MKKLVLFITLFLLVSVSISIFFKSKPEPQIQIKSCEAKMNELNDKVLEKNDDISIPVDFTDFPEAKTYFTRITETVKEGSNFADYYSLIGFGCGTDCVGLSIVNLANGKVIAYKPTNPNYHLQNMGSYFVLEPVYAGQTREYYKIVDDKLEIACTEESIKDMYGLAE